MVSCSHVSAPIGTTTSSADFATQITEEGVETYDACILARVETLMHGGNREDTGGCAAQCIGGLCALSMRDLKMEDARSDLEGLDAVIDLLEQEFLLFNQRFECAFSFLQIVPLVQFAKLG
jgi:hypothetical protein